MHKIYYIIGLSGLAMILAACGPSEEELALQARTQELAQARSELADVRGQLEQLQQEHQTLQQEHESLQQELQTTRDNLQTTTGERDQTRQELAQTQDQVKQLQNELADAQDELAAIRAAKSRVGARLATVEQDWQAQRSALMARIESLQTARDAAVAQWQALEQKFVDSTRQLRDSRAQVAQLETRLQEQADRLQSELDDVRGELATVRTAKSSVGARLAAVEQERQAQQAEAARRIQTLENARDAAVAQWQALEHQIVTLTPQLRDSQARAGQLEARLQAYQEAAARLRDSELVGGYRAARETLNTIAGQLQQLKVNLDDMRSQLQP